MPRGSGRLPGFRMTHERRLKRLSAVGYISKSTGALVPLTGRAGGETSIRVELRSPPLTSNERPQ